MSVDTRIGPPQTRTPGLKYIPSLDGIRAVAVIAVLIFHASAMLLPGGFLGVDVFFVLSGFLITSILLREVEKTGKIQFGRFYLGRARRLLPALLLVLVATAGLALLFAQDAAARVREDIVASLLYMTNWWNIAQDQSYFTATGRPPMLQHLWSLAVEEQFYLVWPLVLLIAFRWHGRFGVRRVALVGAVSSMLLMTVFSFFWNMPGGADPSRLYFGSDTHAMTILAGAALATVWRPGALPQRLPRQVVAILTTAGGTALAAIIWAFVNVHEDSTLLYRGGFLVFAGLCVVVIAVASHPAVGPARILGLQPLKYIGQRSYGLYLWHWPIFMITRPDIDIGLTGIWLFALRMALTFGCAELSYRYVEMPIRHGAVGKLRQRWRDEGAAAFGRRTRIVTVVTLSLLIAMTFWLISVPAPSSATYLGGATEIGTENLDGAPPAPTAPSAPPTGSDLTQSPMSLVGDSVMLGARVALGQQLPKATIDAAVGRQSQSVFARVQARLAAGKLEPIVVIHAGSNGPALSEDMTKLLDGLKDRSRVVLITTHTPNKWMESTNDDIKAIAARYPNVRVADWAAAAKGHREFFVYDGTHTTGPGARAFAASIAQALQAP